MEISFIREHFLRGIVRPVEHSHATLLTHLSDEAPGTVPPPDSRSQRNSRSHGGAREDLGGCGGLTSNSKVVFFSVKLIWDKTEQIIIYCWFQINDVCISSVTNESWCQFCRVTDIYLKR